ncbi:hypothetical protein [Mycolicibacterium chubuense]|uniref:hypothetical protein n=1 Tax=Mycolicibacterium chubuense TaxID=1800 RepID=UPI001300FDAA|nr:hypothetical protein [Mycolicibacterium chubuense]
MATACPLICGALGTSGCASDDEAQSMTVSTATGTSRDTIRETFENPDDDDVWPVLTLYDADGNLELDRSERDGMAPDDYVLLKQGIRSADRAERFNRYLHTAWENLQPFLDERDKPVLYMPDLGKPRAEWTDHDYLNFETLAIKLVTTQQDKDEALRALSAVVVYRLSFTTKCKTGLSLNPTPE